MNDLDCGIVVNTHGIRGEVKIKSTLDDGMLEGLDSVVIGGTAYRLLSARPHKGHVLAVLEGVDTVEKAMALKNKAVTCDRSSLGLPQGHYFYGDIYGFQVIDQRVNRCIGMIKEVQESPAGMLYVVEDEGTSFLIPDVDAFRRGIDFDARTITVETIYGMLPHEN